VCPFHIWDARFLKVNLHCVYYTFQIAHNLYGARDGAVVEALRYKPDGRGFDSRWCH
jgi:hypothetical protein